MFESVYVSEKKNKKTFKNYWSTPMRVSSRTLKVNAQKILEVIFRQLLVKTKK